MVHYRAGQPAAVCRDIAIGRCESHEDFIVEFEIGFFQTWPRSGFPISSSLYYICELLWAWPAADSSKAMLSWLCVPIWTRLWLLTIKYIFRSAFHLSEKDWMHIYEPPATKSSQEESIEYIRCLGIHLLYPQQYKPQPVYFLLHFWGPNPWFQRVFSENSVGMYMVRIQAGVNIVFLNYSRAVYD